MSDRFSVGPMKSGLQTGMKPFAIADDAYAQLNNAYIYRGRLRKRFGSRFVPIQIAPTNGYEHLSSRLRIKIGTTDAVTGNFTAKTVPVSAPNTPIVTPAIGQIFSIGDAIYTVTALGVPANLLRSDGLPQGTHPATFNTTTGALNITNVNLYPLTDVYYYPALPVTGLGELHYDGEDFDAIAFDGRYAYKRANTGWDVLTGNYATQYWTGTDNDFFWTCNARGATANSNLFFATNYTVADGIKYWDAANWVDYAPYTISNTQWINSARIIMPFGRRLLMFNTLEWNGATDTIHANRVRFSQIGSPLEVNGAVELIAFREDIPGKGGWEDIPVKEDIVSVTRLRNRLIVKCEHSVWELAQTGFDGRPFVFQEISSEFGSRSTFGEIVLDESSVGIGSTGIIACDGNSAKRLDNEIPDDIFEISNLNEGSTRIHGIRDFKTEMLYWSVPSESGNSDYPFPNRVLVYNYATQSWAFNDDSFTCFGYILNTTNGDDWEHDSGLWQEDTSTWQDSFTVPKVRLIIAGNQEGFLSIIDADETSNSYSLQITNIVIVDLIATLTIIDHNLAEGSFILVNNTLFTNASDPINNSIYMVNSCPDSDTITIELIATTAETYLGNGVVSRVSVIDILTKQYNFYAKNGSNLAINRVDFLVDSTSNGEITVDYNLSTASTSMIEEARLSGALMGNSILETHPYALVPFETLQNQIWHTLYINSEGQFVQLHLYHSEEQMKAFTLVDGEKLFKAHNDFQCHQVVYNTTQITRF